MTSPEHFPFFFLFPIFWLKGHTGKCSGDVLVCMFRSDNWQCSGCGADDSKWGCPHRRKVPYILYFLCPPTSISFSSLPIPLISYLFFILSFLLSLSPSYLQLIGFYSFLNVQGLFLVVLGGNSWLQGRKLGILHPKHAY